MESDASIVDMKEDGREKMKMVRDGREGVACAYKVEPPGQ
jgi:hypothetical protein